jgi:predicted amidophosphoribosyltransferase
VQAVTATAVLTEPPSGARAPGQRRAQAEKTPSFCLGCGASLNAEAKFCAGCGKQV